MIRGVICGGAAVAMLLGSARPAAATFPGHDAEIVFARWSSGFPSQVTTRSILPDGTKGRSVTRRFTEDASYSPDGSTLAYILVKSGHYILYLVDVDTGNRSRILTADDFPRKLSGLDSVAFGPTGDRLVVGTFGPGPTRGGSGRLYTLDVDGSDIALISGDRNLWDADWSASDRIVAEAGSRVRGATRLVTLDSDGTDVQPLAVLPATSHRSVTTLAWPSWSPDGSMVAFTSQAARRRSDIWLVEADGTDLRRFTDTKRKWESAAVWAPAGNALVVSRGGPGAFAQSDMWLMGLGGGRTRVTDTPRPSEFAMAWRSI